MNRSNQFSKSLISNWIVWNGSRLKYALIHNYLNYSVYKRAWHSLWVKINQYPSYSVTPIVHWLNCCEKRTDEDRLSMYVYSGNQGNALSATCWQRVNLRLIQLDHSVFASNFEIIQSNLDLFSFKCSYCMYAASLFESWLKCSCFLSF